MRSLRYLAIILSAVAVIGNASAAEHGSHIALLVAQQGLERWDALHEDTESPVETPLITDGTERRNLAETNLNWAAALLESGERTELAHQVIEAVLSHQDTEDGSRTEGLFRWYADPDGGYSLDATLYLGPALAHLAASDRAGELRATLQERAGLALQGLLSSDRPKDGVGLAMWAGATACLAAAVDEPEGREAAASAVSGLYGRLKREGLAEVHSPTYDALRIGGLRWALQFAEDETAISEARGALQICYADMLQRYDPATGMLAGAIGTAYPADYLGNAGVARYLLACDLPSALALTRAPSPLAMYFALSDYDLSADLSAMAEDRSEEIQLRTRTPGPEDSEAAEAVSTSTWVADGMSLGTMSGPVSTSSIPIMATCDLPERPTTYFYPFGGTVTLQSAQSGGLALCSFNFDRVGVGARIKAGVQGMLGRRDQIDRVIIGNHDWIGEPEAVGQNTVVAVQRGSSYVGIKILAVDSERRAASVKPGSVEWLREGNMDSLMFRVYARRAGYPLSEPIHDVRVGLLIEVAAAADFANLDEFAERVAKRRVSQSISNERARVDEAEEAGIPGRHEIRTGAEIKFARFAYHEMTLDESNLTLGLREELLRNQLISRTLPVALPEDYLWASPGLVLQRGEEPLIGPAAAEALAAEASAAEAAEAAEDGAAEAAEDGAAEDAGTGATEDAGAAPAEGE